jgi:hypothetical protein
MAIRSQDTRTCRQINISCFVHDERERITDSFYKDRRAHCRATSALQSNERTDSTERQYSAHGEWRVAPHCHSVQQSSTAYCQAPYHVYSI